MSDELSSHPIRVRGLKLVLSCILLHPYLVAPYTGAWIETTFREYILSKVKVAPYTGAWIETFVCARARARARSHPIRVRGLKLFFVFVFGILFFVAPYTGAWIETFIPLRVFCFFSRRTLYGCVD